MLIHIAKRVFIALYIIRTYTIYIYIYYLMCINTDIDIDIDIDNPQSPVVYIPGPRVYKLPRVLFRDAGATWGKSSLHGCSTVIHAARVLICIFSLSSLYLCLWTLYGVCWFELATMGSVIFTSCARDIQFSTELIILFDSSGFLLGCCALFLSQTRAGLLPAFRALVSRKK